MRRIFIFILLLVFSLINNQLYAQITAPGNSYSTSTRYSSGDQDPIFCFPSAESMQLLIIPITGNTYTWNRYNTITHNFDIPAGSGSSITITEEGGYEVLITGGTTPSILRCWVFVPGFTGTATIDSISMTCSGSAFIITNLKQLIYTDVNSPAKPDLYLSYAFLWESEENEIERVDSSATSQASLDIYFKTLLNCTISGLGINPPIEAEPLSIDSTIQVKALYSQTYLDILDSLSNEVDQEQSAEVNVEFNPGPDKAELSMGENLSFSWALGIDFYGEGNNYHNTNNRNTFDYPFNEPGTYNNSLTVTNGVCSDTYVGPAITVSDSKMLVPNVFTPNGDGSNDEFRVSYKSIASFEIIIVNRWGKTVYESTDPNKGWDGRIGGSKAAPGVYYYFVKYKGFDGISGTKKGFLHLITDRK